VLDESHKEYSDINDKPLPNMYKIGGPAIITSDHELVVVEDSRFGIFDALIEMVELVFSGYKVILDFSDLRPKGAYVKGIDGTSSGAISWMKLFDFVAGLLKKQYIDAIDVAELYAFIPHLISQGGQRRGALMLVLNVDHPNIIEFIMAKQVAGRITGANLSVNLTNDFMLMVDLEDEYSVNLFNQICELAHRSAEPGVLFMDRAQELSNSSYFDVIDCCNPCAEEPLPPDSVCNLAHLNLPRFLVKKLNGKWMLDFETLSEAVRYGVRFNDNIIDYTTYFDEDIKNTQLNSRRIGIGTMGLATVLIYLEIKYGSHEAEAFAEMLNNFIASEAYRASIDLGKEKGSFPSYDPSKIARTSFLNMITDGKVPETLRNAALLTQAPTGSTGTTIDNLPNFDCSTGIEPYFAFEYYRASRVGTTAKQEVDLVKKWRAEHPGVENLPGYFVGASDITATEHVRMQACIQKYVDAAISKTINMPKEASVEDVKQAYLLAYSTGCKGVTVYRDGSRSGQVLATNKEDAKLEEHTLSTDYVKEDAEFTIKISEAYKEVVPFKKRPKVLHGMTVKQNTPLGKMYVTLNTSDDSTEIEEVFIQLGQVGSDVRAIVDSLGVLLTLGLSDRLSSLPQKKKIEWLIGKLIGIKGSNPIGFGSNRVDSLPDAIGKVLKDYLPSDGYVEESEPSDEPIVISSADDICPDCGVAAVRRIEGCEKCTNCGASKCG
jgi:ribonucleoside-diphosphate reductase alpha chain